MADPILTNPSAEQQLAQDHSQTESGLDYCFYRHDGIADDKRLEELRAQTPDFQFRFWRPRSLFETPPGIEGLTYKVYSAFHRLKVFSNADYGACILEKPGTPGRHLASVFPRFFRFPFMGAHDLQIGATFTSPELRGRGLAQRAILETVAHLGRPNRRFWYVTEKTNIASRRAAERAGLLLVGYGIREPRLGLSVLAAYRMIGPGFVTAAGHSGDTDRQRIQ